MKVKYLIVGQGIAGTLLSYQLHKRRQSFFIVDKGLQKACSRAGSGLINPITGRRFTISWMFEDLLRKARNTYSELGQFLGTKILYEHPVLNVFYDNEQAGKWSEKLNDPRFAELVGKPSKIFNDKELLVDAVNTAQVNTSLQLDISNMLINYRSWLLENQKLKIGDFSLDDVSYTTDGYYSWADIEFEKIIFCGGAADSRLQHFQHLPFKLSKGQAFIAELAQKVPDFIIKGKAFVVPLKANGLYWIGAHNNWFFDDELPDPEAKEILAARLSGTLNTDFQFLEPRAGIRPATKDRRPLLGRHPKLTHLYIFNGLGTKGASWAPYWSEVMAEYLQMDDFEIPEEVNISRFNAS